MDIGGGSGGGQQFWVSVFLARPRDTQTYGHVLLSQGLGAGKLSEWEEEGEGSGLLISCSLSCSPAGI